MFCKSLIQFSADGRGYVSSQLSDLSPNYSGDNEIMATSFKSSHAHTATLKPPTLTHTSTEDSWTLMGKSGSVSCGVIIPSSWFWCTQASICALQESVSPVLCKFWRLYGGVNSDLPLLMLYPGLLHPEPLPLQQSTADLYLHKRHSNTVLSQSLWGLWVLVCTRYV